jgi:hypothetical protein
MQQSGQKPEKRLRKYGICWQVCTERIPSSTAETQAGHLEPLLPAHYPTTIHPGKRPSRATADQRMSDQLATPSPTSVSVQLVAMAPRRPTVFDA